MKIDQQQSGGWPLRHRMLLSFGITFCLIFVLAEVLIVFGLPFTRFKGAWASQVAETTRNLSLLADARRNELEGWAEEIRADAKVFGNNPSLRDDVQSLVLASAAGNGWNEAVAAAGARLRRHLGDIQESYYAEYWKLEIIAAGSGRILVSTFPREEGVDVHRTAYFRNIIDFGVEEAVTFEKIEAEGTSAMVFSRAIHGQSPEGSGPVIAVLVLHNPMRNIIASLLHEGLGRTGEVILVDQDARLVAPVRYPLPDGSVAQPLVFVNPAQPAVLAAHGVEGNIAAPDYRGVPVLAATRHLRISSELGLGLVAKIDRDELLAPIFRMLFSHLVVVGGALVFGGLVTTVIATGLARPLDALSRAARAIERGDFPVRTAPVGSREMRDVSRSFNAMAGRIQNWHEELAFEVQSRTRELSAANAALLESEVRFRSLFENVHVVSLLIDPDSGSILDANTAAASYYGWTREELKTMNIAAINILPPEKIAEEMEAARRKNRAHFLFEHRLADGRIRDVEVYSGPIQTGGRTVLYSIVHDITERNRAEEEKKRLQTQLVQAQKMESIGRLAGGVAHDFNNMLSVIIGYTELARDRVSPGEPLYADLGEIEQAAKRSAELTRQLLAFARKQIVTPKIVDLNIVVEGMLKMLRRLIGENIELAWLPAVDPWPVYIDPSQIDQLLANLCLNARDAISETGRIIIQTQKVSLDEELCADIPDCVPGDYIMLSVSDNGMGMDEDTKARVFEPFFTTKGLGQGTGLGMATVYGIVKQNFGLIVISSQPGQGTTFMIYLPRFVGEVATDRPATVAGLPHGQGETVLLVEDEPAVMSMTSRLLEALGYRVLFAGNPAEAVRLTGVHANEISLLLTDVIMPEMNGRELADRLLTIKPGLKCLFMSGYTADVITRQGVLEEGMHFIQKPFLMMDLAAKVREVLMAV